MKKAKHESLCLRKGCWYIDFYLPKEFGGKRIRCSLNTTDLERAKYIRDVNINPILSNLASIDVLNKISEQIYKLKNESMSSIEHINKRLQSSDRILSVSECVEKYLKHLKSSSIRPLTFKNYGCGLKPFIKVVGGNTRIDMITKESAIKVREYLIKKGLGGNRIKFIFMVVRGLLEWCSMEGLVSPLVKENLKIPLPQYRAEHTSMIPRGKADAAMKCKDSWTLSPRFARYTGMRRAEILRITANDVIELHGIKCIQIDERSKTHERRIVPIAEKLMPYLKDLSELMKNRKMCDGYNIKLKDIEGCEKCSFHSWRVYANTCMMEAGVDQAVRMKILGHRASKSEVHIGYTSVQISQMKKAVDLIP